MAVSNDYILIREIIDDKIDDEEVKNKIYDLVFEYMEKKKLEAPPPVCTMHNGKICLICKREYHVFSFYSHTGRELKCCSMCRSYQKKYRQSSISEGKKECKKECKKDDEK
jgi:hypothetical protein